MVVSNMSPNNYVVSLMVAGGFTSNNGFADEAKVSFHYITSVWMKTNLSDKWAIREF